RRTRRSCARCWRPRCRRTVRWRSASRRAPSRRRPTSPWSRSRSAGGRRCGAAGTWRSWRSAGWWRGRRGRRASWPRRASRAAGGSGWGVVNARGLKPMDPRLVSDWARRYPVLVTAEDNVGSGGFGAAVLEALAPHGLAGKVRVVALPDRFLPHGKQAEILSEHGLDPDGLVQAVKAALVGTDPKARLPPHPSKRPLRPG